MISMKKSISIRALHLSEVSEELDLDALFP